MDVDELDVRWSGPVERNEDNSRVTLAVEGSPNPLSDEFMAADGTAAVELRDQRLVHCGNLVKIRATAAREISAELWSSVGTFLAIHFAQLEHFKEEKWQKRLEIFAFSAEFGWLMADVVSACVSRCVSHPSSRHTLLDGSKNRIRVVGERCMIGEFPSSYFQKLASVSIFKLKLFARILFFKKNS
jgi:hypothetical protein